MRGPFTNLSKIEESHCNVIILNIPLPYVLCLCWCATIVTSSAASSKTLLPAIIGGSLGVVLIGLFITYFLVKRNNSKARRFEPRTAPHPLPAEGLPASMPEIALDAQLPPVLSAHSTLVQCASDLSILAQDHGFYDSSPTATASSSCTDLEGKQAVRFANGKAHYTLDSASDNLSRSDSAKKSKSDSKLAPEGKDI